MLTESNFSFKANPRIKKLFKKPWITLFSCYSIFFPLINHFQISQYSLSNSSKSPISTHIFTPSIHWFSFPRNLGLKHFSFTLAIQYKYHKFCLKWVLQTIQQGFCHLQLLHLVALGLNPSWLKTPRPYFKLYPVSLCIRQDVVEMTWTRLLWIHLWQKWTLNQSTASCETLQSYFTILTEIVTLS